MFAAALHGPALAGLGLVGSLVTPLLVSSQRPNPWPVVLYLAVVVAAAYFLSRLRRWLWLALASAAGAGLWGLLLRSFAGPELSGEFLYAALLHVFIQTALASYVLTIAPHRGEADDEAVLDPYGNTVLAGLALSPCSHCAWTTIRRGLARRGSWQPPNSSRSQGSQPRGQPPRRRRAHRPGLSLWVRSTWPAAIGGPANWPSLALLATRWPAPVEPTWFVLFAAVCCLGVSAAAAKRLLDGPRLPFPLASFYAGAATLRPLAASSSRTCALPAARHRSQWRAPPVSLAPCSPSAPRNFATSSAPAAARRPDWAWVRWRRPRSAR